MSLKTQIENANALGRENLNAKGVSTDGTETTYEIMSKIADVSGGDNSLDHTVTFMVDGEPYEIVSVKNGNSVNAPTTKPTSESGNVVKWLLDNQEVSFPYTPLNEVMIMAQFLKYHDEISATTKGVFLNSAYGTKSNDGWCILGYVDSSNYQGWKRIYCLSDTEKGCATSKFTGSASTISYNGKTYYYRQTSGYEYVIDNGDVVPYRIGQADNETKDLTKLLDYYYGVA